MKNIIVQGIGYVGAALSVAIASRRDKKNKPLFNVIAINKKNKIGSERIKNINSGIFPFKTKDNKLQRELKKSILQKNITAGNSLKFYKSASVVIICINCDLIVQNKKIDIDFKAFKKGVKEVAENIKLNTLVIVESTVPPGTCEKIIYPIFVETFKKRNLDSRKILLAHSYERVMPGKNYLDSIINYWRVYSGINKKSEVICEKFFAKVINVKKYPLFKLENTTSSETAKLLENSFRAVNIAFIEEWGRFVEKIGLNIFPILEAIRKRPSHKNIMQPGFGVGGYCLTKDPIFCQIAAKKIFKLKKINFEFSKKALRVNKRMPLVTYQKIRDFYNKNLNNKKFLIMGVSYKEDINDTRSSPTEILFRKLKKSNAIVTVHDPIVTFWNEMGIKVSKSYPNMNSFDAIVFTVRNEEYKKINFKKKINKKNILIMDANNVLSEKQHKILKEKNYNLISIGRG
mgnify:FL=1